MASVQQTITAIRAAVPAGRAELTAMDRRTLSTLTRALVAAMPDSVREARRFAEIGSRCLPVPDAGLRSWLAGKRILVTGGTGCVGTKLLGELDRLGAGPLTSVSRGVSSRWPRHQHVEYLHADITSRADLESVFNVVRPDLVFHLAAQRDPGMAEREARRTVRTNVLGTHHVIEAAAEFGVAELVSASTGKALRPYSRELYTAAKRAAEWLLARAAMKTGMTVSAGRFTHLVDNSIIYDRLLAWINDGDFGVIRLHDPETRFYVQSATEAAQLLLCAGHEARAGVLRVSAVSDLGWPVSLLELAVGTLRETGSTIPVYISGHDPGYESVPFPGLYDPETAGDTSPLLNAFEAMGAEHAPDLGTDTCVVRLDLGLVCDDLLCSLDRACRDGTSDEVRMAMDELSWQLLDATAAMLPREALRRVVTLTEPHEPVLTLDHRRMLAGIRRHGAGTLPPITEPGVLR